jgi:hypothetical protein
MDTTKVQLFFGARKARCKTEQKSWTWKKPAELCRSPVTLFSTEITVRS